MNLYEITGQFLQLQQMFEDGDIDEETFKDTLECIECSREEKVDGYGKVLRNIQATTDALDAEIQRLQAKKKSMENKKKWLMNAMYQSMKATDTKKIQTDLFTFAIQKNGGKRKLTVDVPIDQVPEQFRIKQPDTVNGDLVRDLMKENQTEMLDWCHLEPQGESLRFK